MRPFPLFLLFALGSPVVLAQQTATTPPPGAPQGNPQAVASVQAAFAALGGQLTPVPTSLIASGTYTRLAGGLDQSLPIKIEALSASTRWDTNDTNGTVTLVVSRESSWMQGPDGARALAVGETFGRGVEVFPLLLLSRWLGTDAAAMTWVGTESADGRTLNHVTVVPPLRPPSGPQMANCEIWSDSQSNLPARIRVSHSPTDRRLSVPLDLGFSDYRLVNGLLFPFSVTFSIGTHSMAQIQFQSITINAPVSASDFIASTL